MNEKDPTRKSFDRLEFDTVELPPLWARLLAGRQVLADPAADDLREMSKFDEMANVAGLAAHRVLRPAPPEALAGLAGLAGARDAQENAQENAPAPELPAGVVKALEVELTRTPSLVVRGALAGGAGRPFRVAVIVPLEYGAHLAQALQRMLWDVPEVGAALDYALLLWPEPLRRKGGTMVMERLVRHWPAQEAGSVPAGMGVVIGYDDPALAAGMLLDAARRCWAAGGGGGRVIHAGEGSTACDDAARREAGGAKAMIPEAMLIERDGGAERAVPVWANPLLPAALRRHF